MKKIIIFISILLVLGSCFQQHISTSQEQEIPLFFMKAADIDVSVATCRVTAEEMDTIEVALTVTATEISGNIPRVPYGDDRLFEIFCYSSSGAMNYYGSVTVNINSFSPVVNVVLYPYNQEATVTIVGTFGDVEESEEKIVFSADYTGKLEIYMMNVDATNIVQITDTPTDARWPQLSPNRQEIVYQRFSEPCTQGYIFDLASQEETRLPLQKYNPQKFSWNLEGDKLLFYSKYNGTVDIFLYDRGLDSVTCLISDGSCNWRPTFTPDGENIIYFSDKSGTFRLYIANSDGTNRRRLTQYTYGEERAPVMHPTDTNLVVFSGRGFNNQQWSQWGIFIYNRSTESIEEVISTEHIDEKRAEWTLDGNSFIYEHFDGGNYGLYTINTDGTGNKPLLDTSGNEQFFHVR